VWEWLRRYVKSRRTYEAYYREAERLMLWCRWKQLDLAQLGVEALSDYALWLGNPTPLDRWCIVQTPRYLEDGSENPAWRTVQRPARLLPDKTPNPVWRPFIGALGSSARSQSLVIVHGLFEYLSATGYLGGNPMKVLKTGTRKARKQSTERYLEQALWQHVRAYIETWPRKTPRECARYHRTKFLSGFLYLTGLRLTEMSIARTTHLRRDEDGQWWLRVYGKGDTEDNIPMTTDCLAVLNEYRPSTGRSAWPDPRVEEPLVMDITGKGQPLSIKAIHQIMKELFAGAADTCEDPYFEDKLRKSSTHWLRHTSATSQLRAGVPLTVVSKNLRHKNLATTEIYLHTERREQAQETEKHKL
jgi:site-specific recombinase XerD